MRQFHIYKIEKKYQSDEYHALAEGFSLYGLFFSIVWLSVTCIKRGKLLELTYLLLFVFSVASLFLVGVAWINDVVFDDSLGFRKLIINNPALGVVLGVAFGLLFTHFFLGFKGNAIIRWAYQNDKYLGIITASTEYGAITLFKQNHKINDS